MNEAIKNLFNMDQESTDVILPFESNLIEIHELVNQKISTSIEFVYKSAFDKIQLCFRNKLSLDSETVLFVFEIQGDNGYLITCPQFYSTNPELVKTEEDFLKYVAESLSSNSNHILRYMKIMSDIDYSQSDLFLHTSEYFTRTQGDSECKIDINQLEVFANNNHGELIVKNILNPFWGMSLITDQTKKYIKIGSVNGYTFKVCEPIDIMDDNHLRIRFEKNTQKGFIKII